MHLILSNYGLRVLQEAFAHPDAPPPLDRETMLRLAEIRADTALATSDAPWQADLIARGLATRADPTWSFEDIELRYARNPLENIRRFVFEYTTVCNLDCDHCRNGHIAPATESRPELLCDAVDLAIPMGIRRFDFIGGEVILYGARWLRVVEHIRRYNDTKAAVITSGWFVGEKGIKAAGARYDDDRALLSALAGAGLTHVIFSLDGPAELHDEWRKVPGLYDRVLEGFKLVREAGMTPNVSIVVSPALGDQAAAWVGSVAEKLYGLSTSTPLEKKFARLHGDDMNYMSNFIDTGNAVQLRRGRRDIDQWPDDLLRCKNFFRPHPSLRIQATGEVSLCPLVDSGEGYGNVHERRLLDVLNGLQDAFIFKLHAERKISDYKRFLDTDLFGGRFDHICGLRTVVGMLARRMHERGVSEDDAAGIAAINEEVARKAGYLPPIGKTANGTRKPY